MLPLNTACHITSEYFTFLSGVLSTSQGRSRITSRDRGFTLLPSPLTLICLMATVCAIPANVVAQIYYVGDQSTLKDNNGTASFHDSNNWLNFRSPGGVIPGSNPIRNEDANGSFDPGNGTAVFDPSTDHRPSNFGRTPPDPNSYGEPSYLYFGDFLDQRTISQDKFVAGGIARPDSVRITTGHYTFDLGSNNGGARGGLDLTSSQGSGELTVGGNASSATLTVTGGGRSYVRSLRAGDSATTSGNNSSGTLVVSRPDTVFEVEGSSLIGAGTTNGSVLITDQATFKTRQIAPGSGPPSSVQIGNFSGSRNGFGIGQLSIEHGATFLDETYVSVNHGSSLAVRSGGTLVTNALYLQGDAIVSGSSSKIMADEIIVLTTGTLSGNGSIVGDLSVYGTLAPGSSPGILSIDGNLALGASSRLLLEIGGRTAGIDYDQLAVTGNMDVAGLVEISFVNGFVPRIGDHFELFKVREQYVSGQARFEFRNLPDNLSYSGAFRDGNFEVTVTAVPELSALSLAGLGMIGGIVLVSRRQNGR